MPGTADRQAALAWQEWSAFAAPEILRLSEFMTRPDGVETGTAWPPPDPKVIKAPAGG